MDSGSLYSVQYEMKNEIDLSVVKFHNFIHIHTWKCIYGEMRIAWHYFSQTALYNGRTIYYK